MVREHARCFIPENTRHVKRLMEYWHINSSRIFHDILQVRWLESPLRGQVLNYYFLVNIFIVERRKEKHISREINLNLIFTFQ
jgi:hypothetical protein